jgi:hypothetical protein
MGGPVTAHGSLLTGESLSKAVVLAPRRGPPPKSSTTFSWLTDRNGAGHRCPDRFRFSDRMTGSAACRRRPDRQQASRQHTATGRPQVGRRHIRAGRPQVGRRHTRAGRPQVRRHTRAGRQQAGRRHTRAGHQQADRQHTRPRAEASNRGRLAPAGQNSRRRGLHHRRPAGTPNSSRARKRAAHNLGRRHSREAARQRWRPRRRRRR